MCAFIRTVHMLLAMTLVLGNYIAIPPKAYAQEDDTQEPHIVVEIQKVRYLRDVHSGDDWSAEAEAKAVIVTELTCRGRQAAMKLPSSGYVKLVPEQSTTAFAGQSMGVCVNDSIDELYVQLLLLDEDALDPSSDSALNFVLGGLADLFAAHVLKLRGLPPGAAGFAAKQALDYLAAADTMGEATIKLSRSEGWLADGKPHIAMSKNGAVEFQYVIRVADPLPSVQVGTNPGSSAPYGKLVVKEAVFLREGPSRAYGIVTTLEPGDQAMLLGEQNGWLKVQVGDLEGWVGGRRFFQ
jgi:hypothetical protein